MLLGIIFDNIGVQLNTMINEQLKERFESVLEIKNIDWDIVDEVAMSDANILRPIKGIAFEKYLKKIILERYPNTNIIDEVGENDVDLFINVKKVQVKTIERNKVLKNNRIAELLEHTKIYEYINMVVC